MLKVTEQLRNLNSFRTPPPAAPPLSALCAAEEDIARLPTSQFSQLSTPQANRTSSLLFPRLALYLYYELLDCSKREKHRSFRHG